MSRNRLFTKPAAFALAAALILGVAACEDDPTGLDDDHQDPASVRLVLGGQEIATATASNATGEIHLHPDEETDHITVEFLDADGDVIDFEDEDDFYLEVGVGDPSVAEFEQDTPGEFGGHAHGLVVGQTTMTFRLMHGAVGNGHPDFQPVAIPVEVVDDEG
jgi:hypothetical protein